MPAQHIVCALGILYFMLGISYNMRYNMTKSLYFSNFFWSCLDGKKTTWKKLASFFLVRDRWQDCLPVWHYTFFFLIQSFFLFEKWYQMTIIKSIYATASKIKTKTTAAKKNCQHQQKKFLFILFTGDKKNSLQQKLIAISERLCWEWSWKSTVMWTLMIKYNNVLDHGLGRQKCTREKRVIELNKWHMIVSAMVECNESLGMTNFDHHLRRPLPPQLAIEIV